MLRVSAAYVACELRVNAVCVLRDAWCWMVLRGVEHCMGVLRGCCVAHA